MTSKVGLGLSWVSNIRLPVCLGFYLSDFLKIFKDIAMKLSPSIPDLFGYFQLQQTTSINHIQIYLFLDFLSYSMLDIDSVGQPRNS